MTKDTKEETKQSSLIHQRIRKAAFVSLESEEGETFKYQLIHTLNKVYIRLFASHKRRLNSIIQTPRLWISQIDWKVAKSDVFEWFLEAIIEGFTANFATHYLLGWDFNIMTTLAHGFAIKQGLSIYWRLRKDGSNSKIPKKNE